MRDDLPPEARELLARVRADQPRSTPAARARVRAKVADAITLSGTPHIDGLSFVARADAVQTPHYALAVKLATATLVMGLVGGLLLRGARPNTVAPSTPETRPPEAAPLNTDPTSAPSAVVPRLQEPASMPMRPTPSTATSSNASGGHESGESLGTELRLVREADRALRAGYAPAAVKALAAHRARFENGQLAEERNGLALLAECMVGKPGARGRASTYLRRHPSSIVAGRLVTECALREPP